MSLHLQLLCSLHVSRLYVLMLLRRLEFRDADLWQDSFWNQIWQYLLPDQTYTCAYEGASLLTNTGISIIQVSNCTSRARDSILSMLGLHCYQSSFLPVLEYDIAQETEDCSRCNLRNGLPSLHRWDCSILLHLQSLLSHLRCHLCVSASSHELR